MKFAGRPLVEASVEMLGRTFRTSIREGASAEDLIEKIAAENGGGVAKVYYPEFKSWEIVAVKIGDQVLVKGEPDKVARADFSQFSEPETFRSIAIRAAKNSEGGIHFSIGKSGIPLAITDNEQIVFPNAEELRIGKNTSSISLWMTSVNANPLSMADLSQNYSSSGGLHISRDAMRKIEESHGGVRSDKLLLEDNILVLNKDTGEIFTASQFSQVAASLPAPSFDFRIDYSIRAEVPPLQSQIHTHDGNQFRNPYLLVKTFDGQAVENFRIRMNPLPEASNPAPKEAKNQKLPKTAPVPKFVFSLLQFKSDEKPPDDFLPPPSGSSGTGIRLNRPATASTMPPAAITPAQAPISAENISAETIIRTWRAPRSSKIPLGIPSSSISLGFSPAERMPRSKPPDKVPEKRGRKPAQDIKRRRRLQTAPSVKQSAPSKPSGKKPPSAKHKAPAKKPGKRPAEIPLKKKADPRAAKAGIPARKSEKPKPMKKPAPEIQNSLSKKSRKTKPETLKMGHLPARKKDTSPKTVRKKLSRYFFNELMGLFQWKKRGRKLSTKKKSAV
jgi:hypothetical protein